MPMVVKQNGGCYTLRDREHFCPESPFKIYVYSKNTYPYTEVNDEQKHLSNLGSAPSNHLDFLFIGLRSVQKNLKGKKAENINFH